MDSFCGSPFWDANLTWNTESPDFTPCFERTVLVWVPCGFLWIFSFLQIQFALKLNHGRIPLSILGIAQLTPTFILFILELINLSYSFSKSENNSVPDEIFGVEHAAPAIKAITFALALALQVLTKFKGIQSSGILFNFWLLSTISSLVEFQTAVRFGLPLEQEILRHKVHTVIAITSFPLVFFEFIVNCFADKFPVSPFGEDDSSSVKHVELTENPSSPQKSSSFLNQLTFQWVYPLLWRGYKKALEFVDLWELNAEDKAFTAVERFNKYWKPKFEQVQEWNAKHTGIISPDISNNNLEKKGNETNGLGRGKSGGKKIANILPALVRANLGLFATGACFKLFYDLMAFVSPQVLNLLIGHLGAEEKEETWKGYLYMAAIFTAVMLQTILNNNFSHRMYVTGLRLRATLIEAVYQKSLVISNAARKESTVGEMVNLMSVDSQRFFDVMLYVNNVWSAPLSIILAIYFLWAQLGPSVIAGIVILALLVPANVLLANRVKSLKIQQMQSKDERVRLTNEVLTGIKVLKLYAWEPSFEEKINAIRQKEMHVLKLAAYMDSFGIFLWFMAPFVVSLASFATYVLIDENNVLDAQKAFVSLTLFNIMKLPLNSLPATLMQLIQTNVGLQRLNKFMNADEINPKAVTHEYLDNGNNVIQVEKASFSWSESGEKPALRNVNLKVKKGSLVAVVGSVGSGKSSLISAILGEMDKLSGSVNTTGSIAYVSQQSWIQNATLRDNVLFGKRFDPVVYDKVLEACALKPDLKILPGGDQTEIGEKGINLSGGQKQRVSLARAAYNGADLYFFDDPLSAVDAHVGKHLFQKVIGHRGFLSKKTRILVTHGITFLPHVDTIIVMNNGEITEIGNFHELLSNKGPFADFLIQHARVEDLESADSSVVKQLEKVVGSKEEVFARQMTQMSLRSKGGRHRGELARTSSTWSLSSRVSSSFTDVIAGSEFSQVEAPEPGSKLIDVERTETGSVKKDVYVHYMQSMSWVLVITSIISYILLSGFNLYSNIWLSEWSSLPTINGTQDIEKRNLYLGVYGGLGIGQAIAVFIASISMSLGCIKAAEFLQKEMLARILRSPMSFFDTTPLGRIVNRFSKDVDVADNLFSQILYVFMSSFFQVLSTLIVISIGTPYFLIVIVPIMVVYVAVQQFYVASSRQLKRLESVSRSPIFSHFSETLAGTSTIRAFRVQHQFLSGFEQSLDRNQMAYYPMIHTNRWLAVLLESIGNFIVLFAMLFALLSDIDGGSVGLSVSYSLNITINLSWLVRTVLEIETNVVAVERIKEYCETPQEAVWDLPERKPPTNWPDSGSIVFNNYQSRYREGLDLVLRGVNCHIYPGEKIGIVGRTGAGKSSLTLGLFRIVEAAGGSIEIDGKNLSDLGLHDVRRRLTIIPQDPVLFVGTMRLNLDPYGQYSDDSIWRALDYAHLKTLIQAQPGGLDLIVSENGENFSVGQRQLVCLARALLRKTKILILDEATASVDLETDDLIQKTIRSEFADCTVLTIAHRLNTIMDSSRIMVLDKGEISEFDSPSNLINDKNTIFYSLAKEAGITS